MALCELTGSNPCAVLSELVNDDGSMMRGSQITEFAKAHDLEVISIDELSRVLPENKSAPNAWFNLSRLVSRYFWLCLLAITSSGAVVIEIPVAFIAASFSGLFWIAHKY